MSRGGHPLATSFSIAHIPARDIQVKILPAQCLPVISPGLFLVQLTCSQSYRSRQSVLSTLSWPALSPRAILVQSKFLVYSCTRRCLLLSLALDGTGQGPGQITLCTGQHLSVPSRHKYSWGKRPVASGKLSLRANIQKAQGCRCGPRQP